ncbi:oxidation resistance protein 1-like isoform X2 [Sycon ciliatum]|uniref:oxidation resistance protein 1-like isoform X2 n=1 Tax=Sycon ciliatum TaxID=27933 RepID=UPI0020AA69C1|eukprot:scpid42606/ scgid2627/ Oxidation resistance protein 1; Protein C7
MASSAGLSAPEQRRKPRFTRPPLTDEYQVEDSDTLYSIAVSYGCTTHELRRLNRLQTSLIFPGQVLYVPERGGPQARKPVKPAPPSELVFEQSVPHTASVRPTADPLEGVELAGEALDDDDEDFAAGSVEAARSFEKVISCRYVTNNGEGIVPGVLSVTPYHINFNPDAQNRLVIDRGTGRYTVYVALADISSLGVYDNPAQMAISDPPTPSGSLAAKSESFFFASTAEWAKCKTETMVPVQDCLSPSSVPNVDIEMARSALESPSPAHESSHSPSNRGNTATVATTTQNESTESSSNAATQRVQSVSPPMTIEQKARSNRPGPLSPSLPRYLCLRTESLLPHMEPPTPGHRKPEYWFAMSHKEITPLYEFLEKHCPSLEPLNHNMLTETLGSYVIVNSFAIQEVSQSIVGGEKTKSPAEKIQKQQSKPQSRSSPSSSSPLAGKSSSFQRRLSYDLPIMKDEPSLLSYDHLCKLARHLPNSVVGCSWKLAYSTNVHGISLRTMYRNMREMDGPILMAVRDESQHIFGVLSSAAFKVCDKFIGTGQCFLFTFHNTIGLKIFTWTGENEFFVKGDTDALCFGSGEGTFGLWLDENLYHGSSYPCKTYDNEVLASTEQFTIQAVEAWCFE